MLEERLCELEGGTECVLVPSGLAAIATVGLALLKAGDEVLIPDNAYGPGKDFAVVELARYGITHAFFDALNPDDLAQRITPKTRWSGWKPRLGDDGVSRSDCPGAHLP